MYEFDSRVRYSEVDHHGTMTVPALINYFQDCSTFQSEDLGIGTTVLKEEKRAWLLSYWQVILNRSLVRRSQSEHLQQNSRDCLETETFI